MDANDKSPSRQLHVLKVGELYNPSRTTWPEQPQLRLSPQGCELLLLFAAPTSQEIAEVKKGVARFAWVDAERVGVLCYRFGVMRWSDTPFEIKRQPKADQGPPAGNPGDNLLFNTVLVDANTGIIKVIRVTTWPAEFADRVRQSVIQQLNTPYSAQAAGATLQRLYARYDSATLARERADVRC